MFWDPLSLSIREYQSGCGLLEECLASEVRLPCSDSGRAFLLNQASQAGYSGLTSYNQLLVLWRLQMVHNKICNPRIQCLDFVVCCHWPNRCSTAFFSFCLNETVARLDAGGVGDAAGSSASRRSWVPRSHPMSEQQ